MRSRIAEEIRALLARRRMSASELARVIGVTQPYISRRLTGDTPLDVDDLAKIADALGVHISDLLPRPMEGRLITTAAPRGGTGPGTNERSTRLPERPQNVGHQSRTTPPASSRRPARIGPANSR